MADTFTFTIDGVEVEAERGNLAASGWSFELVAKSDGEADVWDLDGHSPSRFSKARGQARSGNSSLRAALTDGGYARAVRNERFTVSPRRQYRL